MNDDRLYGGRYRLLDVIGDGGMARVFRATDTRLDRTVAIKVLREQFTGEPQFIERFKQEARLAAGLAHPNIVGVYDVGEEYGQYYMVMECVPGDNLKQVIGREAPMPLGTVVGFMRQLAAALDYAHTHGVIHRDIKPENILITDRREVKVGDFGIARALAGSALTATGTVLGSVSYFSPEQASGQQATAESDLYSAGMVLFEMLTGHVPFSGPNPVAVAMAQVNDPPALPTNFVPELPRSVEAVVLKAIAKDPAQRYHSGYELMAALTAAAKPAPASPAAAQPEVPRARRPAAVMEPADAAQTVIAGSQVLAATPPRQGRRGMAGAIAALVTTAIILLAAVLVYHTISGNDSATSGATATPSPVPSTTSAKPTKVPVVAPPTETSQPTVIAVPTQTSTPLANHVTVPTDTPPASSTALDTATAADTFTPLPTATAGVPTDSPTAPAATASAVAGTPTTESGTPTPVTATPGAGSDTATPGSSHGATVSLVTAAKVGTHFAPTGVSTQFTAGTSTVYAVAKIHDKAKGDVVKFIWQYPDGSTFPLEIPDVTAYKGNVTAYAQITPRGPGSYSVSTTINGHVLASTTFTVAARSTASAAESQASATTASDAVAPSTSQTLSPSLDETATAVVPANASPVSESVSTVEATPTVETAPTVESTLTVETAPTVESTLTVETAPTVEATLTVETVSTVEATTTAAESVPELTGTVTGQTTPSVFPIEGTATVGATESLTQILPTETPAGQ